MGVVAVIATVVYYLLMIFVGAMWARLLLDLFRAIRRDFRPRGFWLVLFTGVYGITDPPLKVARKVIKPVRTGVVAFDFSWTVVLLVAIVLMYIAGGLSS